MKIWGKIIGAILGSMVAGPIGFFFGLWIGHSFDQGLKQNFSSSFNQNNPFETQKVFFKTTFAVMGHIAKADGVISKEEIAAAEQVMTQLSLDDAKRKEAIEAFNVGKSNDFDLSANLQELIQHCARKPSLIQMFLEIQILAATADGRVNPAERDILYLIGGSFRISRNQIDRLVEMVIAQRSFHQGGYSGGSRNQSVPTIDKAYQVLGISSNSTKAETKRAYRKLMSQHHPDKLVAKGMPEEMIKVATEKSQEIQAAYDMIKKQTF